MGKGGRKRYLLKSDLFSMTLFNSWFPVVKKNNEKQPKNPKFDYLKTQKALRNKSCSNPFLSKDNQEEPGETSAGKCTLRE